MASSPPVSERPEKRPRLDEDTPTTLVPDVAAATATSHVDSVDIDNDLPLMKDSNQPDQKSKPNKRKQRKQRHPPIEPHSNDDVLYHDVLSLLRKEGKKVESEEEWDFPVASGTEVELTVSELSSTGMANNCVSLSSY